MVTNLYEKFLEDTEHYEQSERYWERLWTEVVSEAGGWYTWLTPWMGTGAPHIKDGNPIFSAISPDLRRGVRIIQLEPYEPGLDFQVWFENTEDDPLDPENIQELVIACVLSDLAAAYARNVLESWVDGSPILIRRDQAGCLMIDCAMKHEGLLLHRLGQAA